MYNLGDIIRYNFDVGLDFDHDLFQMQSFKVNQLQEHNKI